MMHILETIHNRREITSFHDQTIPNETLEQLLEAGYLAPAGNNLPSREFILIKERTTLNSLAHATPFVKWLNEATAAIVITGRPDVSKYWLQDASIAAGYIWLAAVDLELGAAFGAIYHAEDEIESEKRESYVRQALSIPEDRKVIAILGFGYTKDQPKTKKHMPREQIIHYERFNN